ncbi:integrase family protein [Paracoccus nototheniae]|uniref:Tyrosine-type recombinase/integrase n=1 Tax=Paracoccus nototheniae TaxID=2489002 RepID=A0ABW4E1S5_9RHOB|nr:integrase family protein [Paracoccus nototheniae]
MSRMILTDVQIRALRVTHRTEIMDEKEVGLMLRVYPSGRRTFAFRIRGKDSKLQNAKIGEYPDVKLSTARLQAFELRQRVRAGEDVTATAEKAAKALKEAAATEIPNLGEIIEEYAMAVGHRFRIWGKTKRGSGSEAEMRIKAVFGHRWPTRVTELSLRDLSDDMIGYRPLSGKVSANGQVSRARAYLSPVFDWSANRKRFRKIGFGRRVPLPVIDLTETHDPASDDPAITGRRDRALDQHELKALLPLLVWPAPDCLGMQVSPEVDIRPIALRFLLLTAARLDELVRMRWQDFREAEANWHKPHVKSVRGDKRQQTLPLSDAAVSLLRSLPNYTDRRPDGLVFPNKQGRALGNWDRITSALQRRSGTSGWHRHDLRRTAATIMEKVKTSERVIDKILAHKAGTKDETVSRALGNYIASELELDFVKDPQRDALDKLAEVYARIENAQRHPPNQDV